MKKRKHLIIEEVDVNKAMEDTNFNMEKPKTIEKNVELPPVYADAVEQHDEIKKNIGKELKSMSDIVKDKGIVPENPGTGKKVSRKPYTEQYQLDESLFEDWDSSDDGFVSEKRCREILNDWIDWDVDDVDGAIEQLRSLNSEGEVSDAEYDYIVDNWDDLLEESLSEALDDVEWKGAAAGIIAQIKKYNPNATYKIQTSNFVGREGKTFTETYIVFDYGSEKLNKDFISYLYKNYRIRKVSDYVFKAYKPEMRDSIIDVEIDRRDPEVRVWVYEERDKRKRYGNEEEPNELGETLVTEKRNNCRGEECANDKEARANRFAQKAAHKEKNDKRDELEESAFNNKIRYYTKSMIPLSLSNLFFMGTGRGPVDIYDAVEDSNSVDELTAKLRDIVDDEIALDRKTDDYVRYTVTDSFGNVSYLKIAIADNLRESVEKCPDCGKEVCECDKKEITESQQPDIFECPICHRNFTLGECEHDDLMCQCPRCHSQLIKTDNGEYTEYNESVQTDENKKSIDEDFNLTISLYEFEPWTDEAKKTWNRLNAEEGALDKLEWELELEYPEGMSEGAFNDLLRFESDWVLQAAGIEEKPDDDEEEEDE